MTFSYIILLIGTCALLSFAVLYFAYRFVCFSSGLFSNGIKIIIFTHLFFFLFHLFLVIKELLGDGDSLGISWEIYFFIHQLIVLHSILSFCILAFYMVMHLHITIHKIRKKKKSIKRSDGE